MSRLSTEETNPFRIAFRVVDHDHPRWSQFRSAINGYETARDCLVLEEMQSENPDLLAIDWRRIGAGAGAEVCLFRIFSTLNSQEAVTNWLHFHEFDVGEPHYPILRDHVSANEQPSMRLSGSWTQEALYQRWPTLIYRLSDWGMTYSYVVQVHFLPDGTVFRVSGHENSVLN